MIDIHCHLLPGIDDGASDKSEALSLLRMAADDGVTRIVITPHFYLGRFDNSKSEIFNVFFDLKLAAQAANIPIELGVAAEVRIDAELLHLFKQGKIPFLGKYNSHNIVLLELPHSHFPIGTENLIQWMKFRKILPLIAHPERNRDIQKLPELVSMLKRLGCLTQITASSITGQFGQKAKMLSKYMLDHDLADVIASDAHNLKRRPLKLSDAFDLVSNNYGLTRANKLFISNPKMLTQSLFI